MTNPFKPHNLLWKVSVTAKYSMLSIIEEYFEAITDTVSCHELESQTVDSMPDDLWRVEAYCITKPVIDDLVKDLGDIVSSPTLEIVEEIDWVSQMHDQFKPITIGRFFITNLAHVEKCPKHMDSVIIESSRAFGTGEHYTTQGCIEAMEKVSKIYAPSYIMDIGTGTGILAIAAAKIWPESYVIGSDIEEVACDIASKHAKINEVNIECIVCAGVPKIPRKANLIVSNILANPLVALAQDFAYHLQSNGYIILSGFLSNQLQTVLEAYTAHHLRPIDTINNNNWITLTLQKGTV
jgi:ribosomal protein L11 methyltransferase